MTPRNGKTSSSKRIHVVLVPGFAGFDALGQLEYYGGITPLFKKWLTGHHVLHYFDNFPTAAVATRAALMRSYLAKRMVRGEIARGDDVVLVGHSTGGLDIRRVIWDLWELHRRKQTIVVDGGAKVKPKQILDRICRVVFLSVPHWGTNIADWVQAQWLWRKALIEELRGMVAGSQLLLIDRIESSIAAKTASLTGAGLFLAVQDALDEANENNGKPSPMRTADAHDAASQLALYLRHMASDFHAIDDLTSRHPRPGKILSPAHFDAGQREEELEFLRDIEFRSYVTLGKRPFRFDPDEAAPPWELTKPWTYPEISKNPAWSTGTDIVYRTCYRACAGGPFEPPPGVEKLIKKLRPVPKDRITVWDNDGIVNTMSMLWPLGQNVLVAADHMDIVGQYRLEEAERGGGRKYQTYDLLKSESGFDSDDFTQLWKNIFAFCVGRF